MPTFPVGRVETLLQSNDSYRQIVEHTCLGCKFAKAQWILQGDTITKTFPNEPTISHEHLASLCEGNSVHSVIMSSILTLLQWNFNPRGHTENILFVYDVFLQQLLIGTQTIRSLKHFLPSPTTWMSLCYARVFYWSTSQRSLGDTGYSYP